ncbi:MAG TPA: endonuclease/exonuclease/phosphatase family protein [Gemmatimonadales bacterium]|jgi:endonuclease/exonuclease/phosphatase family metal-dependent hydrolase|nr:endonuclease/exonuclease/phosphatase family protein [Gemmatimonadales bacterium]
MRSLWLFPLVALITAGCDKDIFKPIFPTADVDGRVQSLPGAVTVMTQNLYVGADVDAVIVALGSPDPIDDLPALLFAIETVRKTDFPARASAIADQIAARRPQVVGLQEASQLDIDLNGLGLPVVVHQDFVAILEAKLAERGLHYGVAAQVQNIVAAPLPGISLVDHDVMLVDLGRVTVTASGGQNFTYNVGVVAPGIELKRGWVWADATIDGVPYRFVSTHPEADLAGNTFDALRAAQVGEIVATQPTDRPVVIMGDLNDVPGSSMYQLLGSAGFTDSWRALRPGVIGFTCCEAADLSNELPALDQRIDYVFARGFGLSSAAAAGLRGQIDRFGDVPADRVAGVAYPVWPSDHAGLVATLR